jgi:hypothetical protein
VREKIAEGDIELKYVVIGDQVVDRLTKTLPKDKFCAFRKTLGLEFTIAGTTSKEVR